MQILFFLFLVILYGLPRFLHTLCGHFRSRNFSFFGTLSGAIFDANFFFFVVLYGLPRFLHMPLAQG